MASRPGHIELERTLASIEVGRRHRTDLGDIDALAASIARDGLLQPITITPDGVLVCGLRRLEALRRLGWKTANVWVRSGITEALGQLLAEQDENALHKPLTATEAATLYRELKALLAEDAARRQEASRFTAVDQIPKPDGPATVAAPSSGDTRAQAARMVTGRNSYTSLERVAELQRVSTDPAAPEAVRTRAAAELASIDAGGSIAAAHQRTHAEMSLAELDQLGSDPTLPVAVRGRAVREAAAVRAAESQARAAELERLAAEALARVQAERGRGRRARTTPPAPRTAAISVRAFVLTWDDLDGWWERCDPNDIGPVLTDEQWSQFERVVAGTVEFAELAAAARRRASLRSA